MGLYRYRNRTSKWFIRIIRPVLTFWLWRRFNIEVHIDKEISEMDGPFVLIGNHVTFWDPFIIGLPIKPDTRYITSDNVFRTRFFRWVMAQVGAIPKTKGVANGDIVRRIVEVIKQKGVVGIFPEARRTWDGRTLALVPQVPKLVSRLKLPVVAARMSGGYLSGPRWGRYNRRGRILIEYSIAISPAEAGTLSPEEVADRMADAIRFNPDEWQKTDAISFKGRRIAEYLERVLFICPACGAVATLRSEQDMLTCGSCSYAVRYLETGGLAAVSGELIHSTVADWNSWQAGELFRLIDSRTEQSDPIFTDAGARLWKGFMSKPLKLLDRGEARLESDAVVFRSRSGTERRFPFGELEGPNVQVGEKLEFYWNKELFQLDFEDPRVSTYKWLRALFHIQGKDRDLANL